MRYTAGLRSSRKHHILKHPLRSSLISLIWFVVALVIILSLISSYSNIDSGQLLGGFVVSLIRISVSYVIALIIALLIALAITSHEKLENLLLPIFDVLQSFPSFALFPILVTALKNSPESVIIIVLTITIIWPILFTIIGGIKNRREDLEEAATIFGAHKLNRLCHFTLPELFPSIITGSIVGWGEGWEFIIGAELLVKTNAGIGTYLGVLGQGGQNSLLAFGIFILMFLLFIINKVVWLPLLHKSTMHATEG